MGHRMFPRPPTWASYICALATVLVLGSSEALAMSDEKRLIKHLLDNYSRVGVSGRPVFNTSDTVAATSRFSLLKIHRFDQQNSLFSVLGIITMKWSDGILLWDKTDFGGVYTIVCHADQIWTPDVVFLNAVAPPGIIHGSRAMVTSEGHVVWSRQVSVTVFCDPEAASPEREEPSCELQFASWTLAENKLSLIAEQDRADSSSLSPNSMWELYKTKAVEDTVKSPCCEGDHAKVTYTITLRRRKQEEPEEPTDAGQTAKWHASTIIAAAVILILTV